MSLGKTIARLRKEKGWKQVDLANMLGVHSTHITRWETDRVRPRSDALEKLAELFEIPVNQLLVGGKLGLAASFDIEDQELVELLAELPELESEELGALKVILRSFLSRTRMQRALL